MGQFVSAKSITDNINKTLRIWSLTISFQQRRGQKCIRAGNFSIINEWRRKVIVGRLISVANNKSGIYWFKLFNGCNNICELLEISENDQKTKNSKKKLIITDFLKFLFISNHFWFISHDISMDVKIVENAYDS